MPRPLAPAGLTMSAAMRWIWLSLGLSVAVHALGLLIDSCMGSWTCVHEPVHSFVETLGASIGLAVGGLLLLLHRLDRGTSFNVPLAFGLIAMSALDALHAVVHVGESFVWLHSTATFAGGLLFALAWLPRNAGGRTFLLAMVIAVTMLLLGTATFAAPSYLPPMVAGGEFTAAAVVLNIGGGLFMLAASIRLAIAYLETRNRDDLLFAIHCALFGGAAIMFEQSQLWDFSWWWWHGLRLAAYAVAFIFAAESLLQIQGELRRKREDLERAHRDAEQRALDVIREIVALRCALNEHTLFSITDLSGRIVDVNDGFCRISGYDREELLGKDHRIVNSGHHPRSFWVEMWKTISSGRVWRAEVCNRAKDGSIYWVDSTNIPQFGRDGKIERYISLRFDISARKQTEGELMETSRRTSLLMAASTIAAESASMDDAIQRTIRLVCDTFGCEIGHAYVVSRDDDDLLISTKLWNIADGEAHAEFRQVTERTQFQRGKGLPGRVLADGRAAWIRDIAVDDNFPRRDRCQMLSVHGAVAFPITVDGRIEAVLEFFWSHAVEPDPAILEALENVGRQMERVFDRVSAQRRLAELQHRFERAVNGANDGLWEYAPQTHDVWYSDQFKELIGLESHEYDSLEPTLAPFLDLLHPDDKERTLAAVAAHLEQHVPYDIEYRLRHMDGEYRWFRARGQAEWDENGVAVRMAGSISDISAQKEAEQTLRGTLDELVHATALANSMAAEAEAANQAKSDFLSNMSHEIRTPMTAILGYTDLLLCEEGLQTTSSERFDALKTIQRNGEHLLSVINDILDMSKIESGKLKIEKVSTRPAQIVEEVASLMQVRAKDKGLVLYVRYDTAIPETILSDPTRLRQILLNLTGNAIKFTETGSVSIHTAFDADAKLMRFRVVDTGIGMTPAQRDAIARFDAFTQADMSTTRRFGGSGLGLRISNSFAQMLGGRIDVESVLGRGSTFTATIAAEEAEVAPLIVPNAPPECETRSPASTLTPDGRTIPIRPLDGLRLLLAEDGPDNQRLIALVLRKAGAKVTIAENGKLAFEAVMSASEAGESFDVILMDMQMPVWDGYAATRNLRNAGYAGPIIALTAHAMASDREKSLAAGCDEHTTKPIDRMKLTALIAEIASKAESLATS